MSILLCFGATGGQQQADPASGATGKADADGANQRAPPPPSGHPIASNDDDASCRLVRRRPSASWSFVKRRRPITAPPLIFLTHRGID